MDKQHERFENEGVVFKAKLIGSELVMEPRGDKMCQNSIQRLKAIIKGTNSHKRRIVLKISFDGVKVYDEKTNEILHHHEVPQISYIASDDTDNRTFGYVSDVPNKAHQFICFKTSGPAIQVMSVLSALFEAKSASGNGNSNNNNSSSNNNNNSNNSNNNSGNNTNNNNTNTFAASPLDITSSDLTGSPPLLNSTAGQVPPPPLSRPPPPPPTNQVPIPEKKAQKLSSHQQYQHQDSSNQQHLLNLLPPPSSLPRPAPMMPSGNHNRSLVYNHSSVSLSDASLTPQSSFATTSPTSPTISHNDSGVDRYAVFNDIDSWPSIFESGSLGSVNRAGVGPTGHHLEPLVATVGGVVAGGGGGDSTHGLAGLSAMHGGQSMMSQAISANKAFSQSFNQPPSYLQKYSTSSSSASAHFGAQSFGALAPTGGGGGGGPTIGVSGALRSTSTSDTNMFRQTNPFDDDFFA